MIRVLPLLEPLIRNKVSVSSQIRTNTLIRCALKSRIRTRIRTRTRNAPKGQGSRSIISHKTGKFFSAMFCEKFELSSYRK